MVEFGREGEEREGEGFERVEEEKEVEREGSG